MVLAWAAVSKLRRRAAVVDSFRGLGLPLPDALASVVPAVEAVLAAGLVVLPRVAAWGSLLMLLAFTTVLASAIRRGVPGGCACFGASSGGRRVSGLDVVRNAALGGLAVLATGAPPGVVF